MLNELLKLLEKGPDNALLRFSIGNTYLKEGQTEKAQEHLEKAVELDPKYSAAWKLYAKVLWQNGDVKRAEESFHKGIEVATNKGDIQAAKEMQVFLKRMLKEKGN